MPIAKTAVLTDIDMAKISNSFKVGAEYGLGERFSALSFIVDAGNVFPILTTGAFSSATQGSGFPMDQASAALNVYADDAGADLTGSRRVIRSRMLYTIDQTTGQTMRGVQGQIKVLDTIDLNHANHVITGIEGYLEFAGTSARTIDGHVACVRAALEEGASGTTTIDATGFFSGFEATLNSTRTHTVNGFMAGFMANISGGTTRWPIGFLAHQDGSAIAFQSGAHSSSTGSGIPVSGASATVRFHSDEGNVDNTGNLRCLLARHLTEANQTGSQTRSGAQLQCKIQGANISDIAHWQGSYNYLEVDGACTLGDGTDIAFFAGCRASIEFASGATITLSANSFASAFRAEWNDAAGATVSGTPGAYMIATPSNGNFVNAIIFQSAGSSYPCGVKASVATPAGDTTHAIKVDIGGTAGYIPVYAAETF